MHFAAEACPVATVAGQWRRLPDGRIQACQLSLNEFRILTRMTAERRNGGL